MDNRLTQSAAIGFLRGKLESNQISLEKFEDYVFNEELDPIDGRPLLELDKFTENNLMTLATSVANAAYDKKDFPKERVEKLTYRIGQLTAQGKLTPTSIAVLCGISSEEFDQMVEDYFRKQSQK